jgi:hypothetical protein
VSADWEKIGFFSLIVVDFLLPLDLGFLLENEKKISMKNVAYIISRAFTVSVFVKNLNSNLESLRS